jgi:hypothetical protein
VGVAAADDAAAGGAAAAVAVPLDPISRFVEYATSGDVNNNPIKKYFDMVRVAFEKIADCSYDETVKQIETILTTEGLLETILRSTGGLLKGNLSLSPQFEDARKKMENLFFTDEEGRRRLTACATAAFDIIVQTYRNWYTARTRLAAARATALSGSAATDGAPAPPAQSPAIRAPRARSPGSVSPVAAGSTRYKSPSAPVTAPAADAAALVADDDFSDDFYCMSTLPDHRNNGARAQIFYKLLQDSISLIKSIVKRRFESFFLVGIEIFLTNTYEPIWIESIVLFSLSFCWNDHLDANEFQANSLIARDDLPNKSSLNSIGLYNNERSFVLWMRFFMFCHASIIAELEFLHPLL